MCCLGWLFERCKKQSPRPASQTQVQNPIAIRAELERAALETDSKRGDSSSEHSSCLEHVTILESSSVLRIMHISIVPPSISNSDPLKDTTKNSGTPSPSPSNTLLQQFPAPSPRSTISETLQDKPKSPNLSPSPSSKKSKH